MACAVSLAGTPEIVASHWEVAIAASVEACSRGHGAPLALELAARLYSPPLRVTRAVAGWHVVETWAVWPDCVATVMPLCDVVVLAPEAALGQPAASLATGHRYLSLDAIFAVKPCARNIEMSDGGFDILHLAGFDGETLRRLVTGATDTPPPPFRPGT